GILFRQDLEYANHGSSLGRFALFPIDMREKHNVPSVNFTHIMNQQHADDSIDIQRSFGIPGQRDCQQSKLPTVFSGVFVAVQSQWPDFSQDAFKLIEFQDEIDDLLHGSALGSGPRRPWLWFAALPSLPAEQWLRRSRDRRNRDVKPLLRR